MRHVLPSVLGLAFSVFSGCGKPSGTSRPSPNRNEMSPPAALAPREIREALARAERGPATSTPEVTSPETRALVASRVSGAQPGVSGTARIGILYFLDSPAHRAALTDWLKARGAEILFEDKQLGYLDARLDWMRVAELIDTAGDLGLDATSFLKLEMDVNVENAPSARESAHRGTLEANVADAQPGLFGAVHSAGFGSRVDAFRLLAAAELGIPASELQGQGMVVASSDSGFNASRTDVFQNRLVDFLVGEENDWKSADKSLSDFTKEEDASGVPPGLEDWASNPTLRFVTLEEANFDSDLNASGSSDDSVALAVVEHEGSRLVRVRPFKGAAFGDALLDYGEAAKAGKPRLVDLRTGLHYVRSAFHPSNSVLGVKIRSNASTSALEVAFVGVSPGSGHGTSNLHMVGGDFTSADGKATFKGVATAVTHVAMQTWGVNRAGYGMRWIPLARNIAQAAAQGADVINLDIYTPGTRSGNDMLSQIACRVSTLTNSVIVVAAHNYGPSANTVQSLAQSPCVLGIGAAHSALELKTARNLAAVDPKLVSEGDDALQTTAYSGRGFGLNGLLKPDIIAPNYGYTAYGDSFIRFGGTSGATPATAGMIALLKQAARKKGTELNFAQVRFLLQGSSRAAREARYRDGYGYVDLEAAWKLLSEISRQGEPGAMEPLLITGQRPLEFVGRPANARLSIPLSQMPMRGAVDAPRRMVFEIEFAGDSRTLQKPWLSLVNNATGELTSSARLDVPFSSAEVESLPLAITLSEEEWAQLPPGDHIALVKGYRADLENVSKTFERVVDFVQPVSLRKARPEADALLPVAPLYAYQSQAFSFETVPGEILFVSASPRCDGVQAPNGDGGSTVSAFELLVDADPNALHASDIMSTYTPLKLSSTPVRIVSRGRSVSFSVARYSDRECLGALSGTLSVRRFGFSEATTSSTLVERDGMFVATQERAVRLEHGALATAGNRRTNWRVEKGEPTLVVSRSVGERLEMNVPAGTKRLRVIPGTLARHQGFLYTYDAKGEVQDIAMATASYSAGLGADAAPAPLRDGFLEIESPCQDCTLVFEPFLTKDSVSTPPRLEIILPADNAKVKTSLDAAPLTSWAMGATKMLTATLSLPAAKPSALNSFESHVWSMELAVPMMLREGNVNSTHTAGVVELDVAEFTFRVPLALR
jgi:hypothetical protein